ncbi:Transmembrane protein, partial [Globisporangium splendens]
MYQRLNTISVVVRWDLTVIVALPALVAPVELKARTDQSEDEKREPAVLTVESDARAHEDQDRAEREQTHGRQARADRELLPAGLVFLLPTHTHTYKNQMHPSVSHMRARMPICVQFSILKPHRYCEARRLRLALGDIVELDLEAAHFLLSAHFAHACGTHVLRHRERLLASVVPPLFSIQPLLWCLFVHRFDNNNPSRNIRATIIVIFQQCDHRHIKMQATLEAPVASPRRVCVECGASVPFLVRDYGKGNVRLAICGACNEVADKYVEYENILLFLEVMLLKPQVYRHVLYNLPDPMENRTVVKMFVILVMLDMNVKAYLIDRKEGVLYSAESMYQDTTAISGFRISQFSLHLVLMALLENVVYFAAVLGMIYLDPFARGWRHKLETDSQSIHSGTVNGELPAQASSVSTERLTKYASAMCISSFGKMFALLTVIWEYHWTFIHMIGGIVFFSNVLGLQLFLADGDPSTTKSLFVMALVTLGLACRFAAQLVMNLVVSTPKDEPQDFRSSVVSTVELPQVSSARSSHSSSRGSLYSAGSSASEKSNRSLDRNQRSHANIPSRGSSNDSEYGEDEGDDDDEEDDSNDEHGTGDDEEPQESSGGLWGEVESFLNRPSPSLSALAKPGKKSSAPQNVLPTLKSADQRRKSTSEPESQVLRVGRPARALYQAAGSKPSGASKTIDPKLLQEAFAYAQKVSMMDFEDDQQQPDVVNDRHHLLGRTDSHSFSSSSSSSSLKDSGASGSRSSSTHGGGSAHRKQTATKESDLKKKKAATKSSVYGGGAKPPAATKKKSERGIKEAMQWDTSNAPAPGDTSGDGTGAGRAAKR